MARQTAKNRRSASEDTAIARAGSIARDNPVASGGLVVMGLTACLIVANALGLQSGRHPAPLFVTRDRGETTQVPEPDGRRGTRPVQEISTLVLDLQMALRRQGLYEGPLDGLTGPATERAIRAFERLSGRTETGQASESLLAVALLKGDAPVSAGMPVPRSKPGAAGTAGVPVPPASIPAATGTNPAASPSPDADSRLMKIQTALSELGYGPLEVDGVMGENTSSAIRRFEFDRGLPLTGEPSEKVVERLQMVSGYRIDG